MPPHDYNPKTHKFKGVSRAQVRREIDNLTVYVAKQAGIIGRRYERGVINLPQFELEMRDLLKSGHIIAASVGRGGRSRMAQADWGRVGAKLKSEYGYLAKFARKIGLGKVPKVATANRAKKYADSVRMSYHQTMRTEITASSVTNIKVRLITNSEEGCEECAADEARGWVNVEDMDELGTRICGNFCKCDLIFEDDYERETGRTANS